MLRPPHPSGGTKGSWLFQGVTGGLRWAQRWEGPSELLLLTIAEPFQGQQKSYSQLLWTAASISIPSQRCRHPGLTLPGVLLSLPAKDKAAEPAGSRVPGKFPPGKIQLNHPGLLPRPCRSESGSARAWRRLCLPSAPGWARAEPGRVARVDMRWAESGSCPCRVPAGNTIAGTQPVPWGNRHTKPAATATRPHCRGGFLPATARGRHLARGTGMGKLYAWDGHHIPKQQGLTVKAPQAGPSLNPVGCRGDPRGDAAAGAVVRLVPGGK